MPEAALNVRPATRADLPGVLALYVQPGLDDGRVLPLAQAEALLARFAAYPDYSSTSARKTERSWAPLLS